MNRDQERNEKIVKFARLLNQFNQCDGVITDSKLKIEIESLYNELDKAVKDAQKFEELNDKFGCNMEVLYHALYEGFYADVYGDGILLFRKDNLYLQFNKDLGWGIFYIDGFSAKFNGKHISLNGEFYSLKNYKEDWFLRKDKSE